jgi:transposase-like protein
MRSARTDVLAFAVFPRAHWHKVWSNNPLERLNKEVKHRSNVVGIFANDRAAIRSPANTTNGLSPAATSRRDRWPSSPPRATLTTNSRPSAEHTEDHPRNPTTSRELNPWINEM